MTSKIRLNSAGYNANDRHGVDCDMKMSYYGFCPARNGTIGIKLDIQEQEDSFGVVNRSITEYYCTHKERFGCGYIPDNPRQCPLLQEADRKLCGHINVRPTA